MKKNTTVLTMSEVYEFVKGFTEKNMTISEGYKKLLSFTKCSELKTSVQYDKDEELNDIDFLVDIDISNEMDDVINSSNDLLYFSYTIPGKEIEITNNIIEDVEKHGYKGYWSVMFDGQHFQGPIK